MLSAEGNIFAGPTNCASSTNAIVRSSSCTGGVDLGVIAAAGTIGHRRSRQLPVVADR